MWVGLYSSINNKNGLFKVNLNKLLTRPVIILFTIKLFPVLTAPQSVLEENDIAYNFHLLMLICKNSDAWCTVNQHHLPPFPPKHEPGNKKMKWIKFPL